MAVLYLVEAVLVELLNLTNNVTWVCYGNWHSSLQVNGASIQSLPVVRHESIDFWELRF